MSARAAVLAFVGVAAAPMAWAQEDAPTPSRAAAAMSEPPPNQEATPSAESSEGPSGHFRGVTELATEWTDNFFRRNDNSPHRSGTGFLLKPSITYTSAAPRIRFVSDVGGSFGVFTLPGKADDYYDLHGGAGINWQVADRHQLAYDAIVRKGHDPFGEDRTENTPTENRSLDRWVKENYNLIYKYGTPRGMFDFETRGFVINKNYHTNRASTEFLDHDIEGGQGTVFYNYSPKTKFLADFLGEHIHFDQDFAGSPTRNGDEYRIHGGLRWLATAKTTGDVRIGYLTREFESPARRAFHGLDWVVSAAWSPTSYRLFVLRSGRASVESYNSAGFIDLKHVNAEWREEWWALFHTRLGLGWQDIRFVGNSPSSRTDRGLVVTGRAEYRLMPRLMLFGSYDYYSRTSTRNQFAYDKNTATVGLRVSY